MLKPTDDSGAVPRTWAPATIAAQAAGRADRDLHGVVAPIHVATTFERAPDNSYPNGYAYGRSDNATVRDAEAVIAELEGAREAMVLGSGMSAASAIFHALSPGDHVVAPTVMYWGLRTWLAEETANLGLHVEFVPNDDLAALRATVRPGVTKLVWVETPSNPLWTITDIAAVADIAHAAGARVVADSTVSTPVLTKPLDWGADIVMHSATKYLNGHSDVIAGALATRETDAFWERIKRLRSHHGFILGPFEAFLLVRGMRTLDLRVRAASRSALTLARRLQEHPCVKAVLYPGLEDHPGYATAARQMTGGFGGMLSFRLHGGEAAAVAAASRVELWKRATSLGGVESLIEHRASIEGQGTPCPPDLLRLSTGIEAVEDLYDDLDAALRGG